MQQLRSSGALSRGGATKNRLVTVKYRAVAAITSTKRLRRPSQNPTSPAMLTT